MSKLVIKTRNKTCYDGRLITKLVQACCRYHSLTGTVIVHISPGVTLMKYRAVPLPITMSSLVDLVLPKKSVSQRLLVWCIQRAVLDLKHVDRRDMLDAQKYFYDNGLLVPKWVPEKIRLPLVLTDLQELPKPEKQEL